MTDAQRYASIALVGSGMSVAAYATAIAVAVRVAMRITRRNVVVAE
jgi:hypothetical protein